MGEGSGLSDAGGEAMPFHVCIFSLIFTIFDFPPFEFLVS